MTQVRPAQEFARNVAPREDLASLPVQAASAPRSDAAARARFFNSGNAFNLKLPRVPAAMFVEAARAALAAPNTGFVVCDQSSALAADHPATTPLILARYVTIAANDQIAMRFAATGAIWYVIAGNGTTRVGNESFAWAPGDVFLTPGDAQTGLATTDARAVLWLVTNEPQLAFEGVEPVAGAPLSVDCVHYPAAEIARQLERVIAASRDDATAGIALIFSSERGERSRNILPTLTLSLNTLPAGEHQRAHRHNSAAVTLVLDGECAYSMVGDERCDWSPYATLVTPATEPHSHHNDGTQLARFLIVQDGGLHYYARTMDFTFLEPTVERA